MNRIQATVQSIQGLIIKAEFEGSSPALGQLLTAVENPSVQFMIIGVEQGDVLVALNLTEETIKQGQLLRSSGEFLQLPVGTAVLGRVFDALGRPIDSDEPLGKVSYIAAADDTNTQLNLATHSDVIETGVKVIDFFAPFVRGRKIGIVGGAGVGKTVLTTELMHNVAKGGKELCMFVGIGERIREAYELHATLKEANLLKDTIMYLGQMNENAALRFLVGRSASSVARYFRDEQQKDVLMFVDNIYRFLQAGNELSTMLEAASSQGGYQPTLFTELSRFEQNLGVSEHNAITSVQSVFMPADDLSDPAVVEMYQQLDSIIVLSREVMEQGIFPAVDLLNTTSSLLIADIVGDRHAALVPRVQAILQKYRSLQGIVAIIGQAELSVADQNYYRRAQELIKFFTQDMFVTQKMTGLKGQYVSREETLKGVEKILGQSNDNQQQS